VSEPSVGYEKEADLVAEQIMKKSNTSEESYLIKKSSVDKKIDRMCYDCEDEEEAKTKVSIK